jgi:hypothetical protein
MNREPYNRSEEMPYKICDIIDKLISIEEHLAELYFSAAADLRYMAPAVSIVAKVLGKEEQKCIYFYEDIKKAMEGRKDTGIDIYIYDKVAKLLYEFKRKIQMPHFKNMQELARFALEFKSTSIGLLLDIQGRFVISKEDTFKTSYEIMTRIIEEEKKREQELKNFLICSLK